MANVIINDSNLIAIGNAIREKNGTEDTYKPREMAEAILAITTGGGGGSDDCNGRHIPDEALVLTGDLQYYGAGNNLNWLLEQCGDEMSTEKVTGINAIFYGSNKLTEVPFDLNLELTTSTYSIVDIFSNAFTSCSSLKRLPKIILKSEKGSVRKVFFNFPSNMFQYCDIEEDFITKEDSVVVCGLTYGMFNYSNIEEEPSWLFDMINYDEARTLQKFGSPFPVSYSYCRYLKKIPSFPKFWNDKNSSYSPYYSIKFNSCYNLQEIVLPRPGSGEFTSTPNGFSSTSSLFDYSASLKKITFDVQEDGTPYTANWKNVTFTVYGPKANDINGSTLVHDVIKCLNPEKCVTDDESYQRLKNDPEYWVNLGTRPTTQSDPLYEKHGYYSAWNHDAAFELIKTLPDCSTYLALKGGTNTLKLRGNSGEGTDGGAINTLTEEEIAVATAKGWTVTFS